MRQFRKNKLPCWHTHVVTCPGYWWTGNQWCATTSGMYVNFGTNRRSYICNQAELYSRKELDLCMVKLARCLAIHNDPKRVQPEKIMHRLKSM